LADALSRWNLHTKHQHDFELHCAQLGLQYTFIRVQDHVFSFQVE
jgi:hypothetical protein